MIISSERLLSTYAMLMAMIMTEVEYYDNDCCLTVATQTYGRCSCLIISNIQYRVFLFHHHSTDELVMIKSTKTKLVHSDKIQPAVTLELPNGDEVINYYEDLNRDVFREIIEFLVSEPTHKSALTTTTNPL